MEPSMFLAIFFALVWGYGIGATAQKKMAVYLAKHGECPTCRRAAEEQKGGPA